MLYRLSYAHQCLAPTILRCLGGNRQWELPVEAEVDAASDWANPELIRRYRLQFESVVVVKTYSAREREGKGIGAGGFCLAAYRLTRDLAWSAQGPLGA